MIIVSLIRLPNNYLHHHCTYKAERTRLTDMQIFVLEKREIKEFLNRGLHYAIAMKYGPR